MSVYGLLLFASTLFFGDEIRLLTYIRSLFRASQHATLMGFRAPAPNCCLVLLRTWTFTGFADAGSTCSPSFRMLRNRGWKASLSFHYGSWFHFAGHSARRPLRLVIGAMSNHRPSHSGRLIGPGHRRHIRMASRSQIRHPYTQSVVLVSSCIQRRAPAVHQ